MNDRQLALLIRAIDAGGTLELRGCDVLTARALASRDFGYVIRFTRITGVRRHCPPTLVIHSDIMALAAALRKPA